MHIMHTLMTDDTDCSSFPIKYNHHFFIVSNIDIVYFYYIGIIFSFNKILNFYINLYLICLKTSDIFEHSSQLTTAVPGHSPWT